MRVKSEQKLHVNLYTEPPTLDPRKATDATSVNVQIALFEGLTRMGLDHQPAPAMADKIDISDDQLTYVFKLKNALWSNGDAVTAKDFLFAWSKTLEPSFPAPFAYKLFVIKNARSIKEGKLPIEELGVRVINDKTLEIKLENPTPYFLELLAFPTFFPLPEKASQVSDDWLQSGGSAFISNGPFNLQLWDHENEIKLIKNRLYWDAKNVRLEEITMIMLDDTVTEYYMYEMGELDWAGSPLSNLPVEILPALKKEDKVQSYPVSAIYFYKINVDHPFLSNVNIRKALAYAIDRKAIVQHILQAGQMPAMGMIPPMPGFENPVAYFPDHDVPLAQEHFANGLKELGLKMETFPKIELSYNTNREHQKIAQAIQQQWQETLGIRVDLMTYDWKVYLSRLGKQEYQIARSGWIGDFADPISFLEPFKYKDSDGFAGNNETGWTNPKYAAVLSATANELNSRQRAEDLRAAEALLMDGMPVIPLYYIVFNYLKKPYVNNVYLSSIGTIDFKWAYIGDVKK